MVFRNEIRGQNTRKQLEERAIYPQHGEEENNSDEDAEKMAKSRLASRYTHEDARERVCNQQT